MSVGSAMKENDFDRSKPQGAAVRRPSAFRWPRILSSRYGENGGGSQQHEGKQVVDVPKLGAAETRLFFDGLIKDVEKDNLLLLRKQKERLDRVNVKLPTVEVRYDNLSVEAECEVVQGKPLPTLWNAAASFFSGIQKSLGLKYGGATVSIIKNVSGVIKPSRKVIKFDRVGQQSASSEKFKMTLLLGPPGCGKTTFLLSLSGKLDESLKVTGEISYNGFKLEEFVPGKTSTYVSQHDLHIPEMTVRETIDFSSRLQGVGSRAEIMKEVIRKEEEDGIVPEPDVDTYMKAVSSEGLERSLQTNYILKIMGLDICADIIVGDAMRRGISGGQKKRLTTGEMIVGPTRALFMDEISTGLDSSTTLQVVTCLQQLAHITEATVVVSLLQPAPETYQLFDDIILMAEGKIVYQGPRSQVLTFFEECGFRCPERKGAADFLQEILSKKDQEQYWHRPPEDYSYVSVNQFSEEFKASQTGKRLAEELSDGYDRSQCHKNALSTSTYSLSPWELLKACVARESLLMKRNSFVYIFKTSQLALSAVITMSVFTRNHKKDDMERANYCLASLFYAFLLLTVNGFPEIAMTVARLPCFYKQRDFYFYPAWAYAIPAIILKIPISLLESLIWTSLTYYVIGYSPEAGRFLRQFFILFLVHQMSLSLFRFLASYFQTIVASTLCGSLSMMVFSVCGGFILPRSSIPVWLKWAYWVSPFTYPEIGLATNEFLAPRWQKSSSDNETISNRVLTSHGLNYSSYFFWIAVGALVGYATLFNVAFTIALAFKRPIGKSRAIISREKLSEMQEEESFEKATDRANVTTVPPANAAPRKKERIVLPFEPLSITFQDLQYYVDTPPAMRERGCTDKRLQLLHDITGSFRPGILSVLMGVTGAGKTTLLDVLSGRKTGGLIEGDIRIGGYPKVQETFARISGYFEQIDVHSPQITVEESVIHSAWLRLPSEVDSKTRREFINEVLGTTELDEIKDALVGIPGVSGLSTEQRKRLTIAVELVANPSIIFMDEPTSGLDARAAAIVMRAVKNIAETGRTVVCTIHQPSIDIFESFDELILMKAGGKIIYSGSIGQHSSKVIEYFQGVPRVPKFKTSCNPATWVMAVTSTSMETQVGVDYAQIYKESTLYEDNKKLVERLSTPSPGSRDLNFPTPFPRSSWVQFKACLWKQYLSYWRSPSYNLVRVIFMLLSAVVFGVLFWKQGKTLNDQQSLFNMLGAMYVATNMIGINNCSSVIPFIVTERSVLYREQFAGMYSPWSYSLAQVVIEIPYVFFLVLLFTIILYPAIGYYWSAYKFLWFFYTMFCTILSFVYLGMLLVAVTPNLQVATILAAFFYNSMNLFSGFLLPGPQIPKWWTWFYYIVPTSWALRGFFTSQYGDIEEEITVFGEKKSVAAFLRDYYGFHRDQMELVALVLIACPIVYASLFALFIGKLNFQIR